MHEAEIEFANLDAYGEPGRPRDLGDTSYELSPQLRRWVEARDRTCRFPNRATRAVYCDADHALEWPVGTTSCANCGLSSAAATTPSKPANAGD